MKKRAGKLQTIIQMVDDPSQYVKPPEDLDVLVKKPKKSKLKGKQRKRARLLSKQDLRMADTDRQIANIVANLEKTKAGPKGLTDGVHNKK